MTIECCLTLVLPARLEDEVVDHLLAQPIDVGRMVIAPVRCSGQDEVLGTVAERVRGRSDQVQLQVCAARSDIEALLDALRAALPSPRISWWITPVIASGRLG